ncbi:MAG: phage Gp37/Gp68 family protein [Acidobacteria bacterium]|nr:phage Gp37/Gp68 family protein [Acidobacteriota bacterium]
MPKGLWSTICSSRARRTWPTRSSSTSSRSTEPGGPEVARSAIEWTEATWNPVTGCNKVSPGCKHCYAEVMARRLEAMGQPNYRNGFELTLHPHMLGRPLAWRRPQMIFVNSMSDLFHESVPVEFIQEVFGVMARAHWQTFQVLTKRAERLEEIGPRLPWPDNVWMGVSVEREDYASRIDHLRRTPAQVRFLSLEPLLGPMPGLDLRRVDWVIVGGESGPHARPMDEAWVLDILRQCRAAGVPFFFKQWGGRHKKTAGRRLRGRIWEEMPVRKGDRRAPATP